MKRQWLLVALLSIGLHQVSSRPRYDDHAHELMTPPSDFASQVRSGVNMWDVIGDKLTKREDPQANNYVYVLNKKEDKALPLSRQSRSAAVRSSLSDTYFFPTIMAEMLPAALVSRHPALITLSNAGGCPSGHFRDIKGDCKREFQYTVNFGSNVPSRAAYFRRRQITTRPTDFLWTHGRLPYTKTSKRLKTFPPTLRELAKSSTLLQAAAQKHKYFTLSKSNNESSNSGKSQNSSGEVSEKSAVLPTLDSTLKNIKSLLKSGFTPTTTPVTTTTDHDD